MSTDSHTPGPWVAEDAVLRLNRYLEADIRVGSRDTAGNIIATVFMGGGGATLNNKAVVEANARLIASAPAMKEALQEILRHDDVSFGPIARSEGVLERARSALNSTGGEDAQEA